jgi:hypothetical protein
LVDFHGGRKRNGGSKRNPQITPIYAEEEILKMGRFFVRMDRMIDERVEEPVNLTA